jgi:hypothetical protein
VVFPDNARRLLSQTLCQHWGSHHDHRGAHRRRTVHDGDRSQPHIPIGSCCLSRARTGTR